MRIPIVFRVKSAPGQMLSFDKLQLIVLLDGDEHSMMNVRDDYIMLARLKTHSAVEWPHDVMVEQGQCYSVSVLLDLPEYTSLFSASVNFCVGRGDTCAAAATTTTTTTTTTSAAPDAAISSHDSPGNNLPRTLNVPHDAPHTGGAAEPGAGSEGRYGRGHDSEEEGEGEGVGSWDAGRKGGRLALAPTIAVPRAASNVCVGHIHVQVLGLAAAQALLLPPDTSPPNTLQAMLRFDGHLISTEWNDIMRTGAEALRVGADEGADLHGVHTLQLDLIQTGAHGADAGVPVPLYTHTVGFRVSNDLTCLTLHDQQRHLAAHASSPLGHRERARVAGALRRQQDLFLASLFVFPALPQGGVFGANSHYEAKPPPARYDEAPSAAPPAPGHSGHRAGARDEDGARGAGKAAADAAGEGKDAAGEGRTLQCSFTGLCHKIYMRHLRVRAAEEAEAEAAAKEKGEVPLPQGHGASVESTRAGAPEHLAREHQAETPQGDGGGCSWGECSWDGRVRRLREGPLSRNTLAPPVALDTGPSSRHPPPSIPSPEP